MVASKPKPAAFRSVWSTRGAIRRTIKTPITGIPWWVWREPLWLIWSGPEISATVPGWRRISVPCSSLLRITAETWEGLDQADFLIPMRLVSGIKRQASLYVIGSRGEDAEILFYHGWFLCQEYRHVKHIARRKTVRPVEALLGNDLFRLVQQDLTTTNGRHLSTTS